MGEVFCFGREEIFLKVRLRVRLVGGVRNDTRVVLFRVNVT